MPAKKLENYTFDLHAPLQKRIMGAPRLLIDYLQNMDKQDNYSAYELTAGETGLVTEYLVYLPGAYKRLMEQKLIGIYFVDNFLGGGMTDYVLDKNENLFFILILNPEILKMSLHDWIAFRDNSSFEEGRYVLDNTLDNRYKGLLHTLIHEASHMYDYYHHATPYVEGNVKDMGKEHAQRTPVTDGIWAEYRKPVDQFDFLHGKKISAYSLGKKLPNDMIPGLYRGLSKTPFASLYASQNWAEDFAELCTWYYLYKKFNLEYTASVSESGSVLFSFSPLKNNLVTERFRKIQSIFK